MSQFTAQELAQIKEERNLNAQQLIALQKAATSYSDKISKQDLLDSFRKLGYIVDLFEEDLKARFAAKEEKEQKPVRITYDLLPSGKVENFTVEEVK